MADPACRCGWSGEGDHPCHRCHVSPGTRRLYSPRAVALAGVQLKFEVSETNACDPCWGWYSREVLRGG